MGSSLWGTNVYIASFIILSWISIVASIDCFKCVSMNGRSPQCDDPFHNNHSLNMLESPCMGGRKGRDGLFPATSCIKIAGVFDDNGESITVRGCGLDSGTATTDTEIIRMSHCGRFYYNDRHQTHGESITVRGCGLDSGTATTDTEIIRMSHCGRFYYNDRYVHGCLQSCNDADACNSSSQTTSDLALITVFTLISSFISITTLIMFNFTQSRS